MMPGYFLDTNVFIQAQKVYYGMDIVPAFWEWLDKEALAGNIFSSSLVLEELKKGDDELVAWAKEAHRKPFFEVPTASAQVIFAAISEYVIHHFKREEADAFLDGADPWLIAQAKAAGAVVVTMEAKVGPGSSKVKIPNICEQFDVPYQNTFELLRALGARFRL
ncbi:MAG: DUF4411 family protein [Phaeodactylibacter sp.]|nr:DUF4411 family protein [Phaeodactylibacter sp.]